MRKKNDVFVILNKNEILKKHEKSEENAQKK